MIEYQQQIDNVKKLIMSTRQAATIWNLSQDYIKILCRQGKIACFRLDENDPKSPYLILKDQPNPSRKK